jgi:hypothetical protein
VSQEIDLQKLQEQYELAGKLLTSGLWACCKTLCSGTGKCMT